MEAYVALARKYDLFLIEDCAQAQLAEYGGRPVGAWGDLGCYSFGGKHMTTGDGGMVISNRDDLAHRLKWFADKGNPRSPVYEHYYLAPNYRMTDLQGAVGIAQLKKVTDAVRRKQWVANHLNEVVDGTEGLSLQPVLPQATHSYWAYGFHVDAAATGVSAAQFAAALQAEGVPANAPYMINPVYKYPVMAQQRAYGTSDFSYAGEKAAAIDYGAMSLQGSEDFLDTTVVMPMNPSYTERDVADFSTAIKKVSDYYRSKLST